MSGASPRHAISPTLFREDPEFDMKCDSSENVQIHNGLEYVGSCDLPTTWGSFRLHGFFEVMTGKEHLALVYGSPEVADPALIRVHSECLTGDALFSLRCDCGAQLEEALRRIVDTGSGVLIYLRQEGRGIGLLNKIRAYKLQDQGADTVEANIALGFAADERCYELCKPILATLGISAVRLMTNNPKKVEALKAIGINVCSRESLRVGDNCSNERYLSTKQAKLGHLMFA
jgi:GTP cyclohydrolase II